MTQKYQLKDLTPTEMQCLGGLGCPAIYNTKRITPELEQCCVGACNEIYETQEESYLIIGTLINPEEAGLEGKVGKNEALIKVPKGLIDNRKK